MGFKLVRIDTTEPRKINLNTGAYYFGRETFAPCGGRAMNLEVRNNRDHNFIKLECHDSRVSRRHGSMEVKADCVVIEALHINPCFYKLRGLEKEITLAKGEQIELCNGDQFGLIPHSFWFEIIQCELEPTIPSKHQKIGTTEDQSQSLLALQRDCAADEVSSELQNTEPYQLEFPVTESEPVVSVNDHPQSPLSNIRPAQNNQPKENEVRHSPKIDHSDTHSTSTTPRKRSHSTTDESSPKKIKTEPLDAGCETQKEDGTGGQNVKIKTEPQEVKKEPQSPDGTTAGSSQLDSSDGTGNTAAPVRRPRERCYFGTDCYRRNLQHKQQFSHPGDADYGSGACPYGESCLRRDPRHWTVHTHPASMNPPARDHRNILPTTQGIYDDGSEEDYGSDDYGSEEDYGSDDYGSEEDYGSNDYGSEEDNYSEDDEF